MKLINRPNWPTIDEATFERILKGVADYERRGYIGAVEYSYRYNGFHFATVWEEADHEVIYVHPDLMP